MSPELMNEMQCRAIVVYHEKPVVETVTSMDSCSVMEERRDQPEPSSLAADLDLKNKRSRTLPSRLFGRKTPPVVGRRTPTARPPSTTSVASLGRVTPRERATVNISPYTIDNSNSIVEPIVDDDASVTGFEVTPDIPSIEKVESTESLGVESLHAKHFARSRSTPTRMFSGWRKGRRTPVGVGKSNPSFEEKNKPETIAEHPEEHETEKVEPQAPLVQSTSKDSKMVKGDGESSKSAVLDIDKADVVEAFVVENMTTLKEQKFDESIPVAFADKVEENVDTAANKVEESVDTTTDKVEENVDTSTVKVEEKVDTATTNPISADDKTSTHDEVTKALSKEGTTDEVSNDDQHSVSSNRSSSLDLKKTSSFQRTVSNLFGKKFRKRDGDDHSMKSLPARMSVKTDTSGTESPSVSSTKSSKTFSYSRTRSVSPSMANYSWKGARSNVRRSSPMQPETIVEAPTAHESEAKDESRNDEIDEGTKEAKTAPSSDICAEDNTDATKHEAVDKQIIVEESVHDGETRAAPRIEPALSPADEPAILASIGSEQKSQEEQGSISKASIAFQKTLSNFKKKYGGTGDDQATEEKQAEPMIPVFEKPQEATKEPEIEQNAIETPISLRFGRAFDMYAASVLQVEEAFGFRARATEPEPEEATAVIEEQIDYPRQISVETRKLSPKASHISPRVAALERELSEAENVEKKNWRAAAREVSAKYDAVINRINTDSSRSRGHSANGSRGSKRTNDESRRSKPKQEESSPSFFTSFGAAFGFSEDKSRRTKRSNRSGKDAYNESSLCC